MFSCSKCDAQFAKWAGRCSECGGWGTVTEKAGEPEHKKTGKPASKGRAPAIVSLGENKAKSVPRVSLQSEELARVLGGGLVPGSVLLISGEPGIGKSTLVLSLAHDVGARGLVLYASGEESPEQIGSRAERLGISNANIKISSETGTENIVAGMEELKPSLTIVDSIQTARLLSADGEPGTPTQVRGSTALLVETAKRIGAPLVIIGQVTKEGSVAGPKLLEHLVDVVLSLEGDSNGTLRVLRAVKNRFGSTNDVGLFGMTEKGLVDVKNPSAMLLRERVIGASGSVVTSIIEGSRPLFVEIQALVTNSPFQFPVRKISGVDQNRLHMILAVLTKRAGMNLSHDDVHVNAVGGIDARDPSADLAIALAIVSSKLDVALPDKLVAFGEIGLAGELRSTPFVERRVKEAQKLGFTNIIAPGKELKDLQSVLAKLNLR